MTRALLIVAVLSAVYALALGSLHPLDLAFGAALAAALVWVLRHMLFAGDEPRPVPALAGRLAGLPGFCLAVVRDVVRGTVDVSLVTLGRRPLWTPGVVEVPVGERTTSGVAVSGLATTLSPGAVLIDVDEERGVMLVHVLDARDPDAVRAAHERFYRRHQRRVFP